MDVISYVSQNIVQLLIWLFGIGLIIFAIFRKDVFIKKAQEETLSFFALAFSLSIGFATNIFKPSPLKIARASIISGETIVSYIPIGLLALVFMIIVSLIFFIPKENKKRRRK